MNMAEQFDEALERIDIALGNDPDDEHFSLGDGEAIELLNQLSKANRKAVLLVAAISKSDNRGTDVDFACAVARRHRADPGVVLYAEGWTPAPGTLITPQQTIALKLAQHMVLFYEWKLERLALAN